jgi:hypothetical protein
LLTTIRMSETMARTEKEQMALRVEMGGLATLSGQLSELVTDLVDTFELLKPLELNQQLARVAAQAQAVQLSAQQAGKQKHK